MAGFSGQPSELKMFFGSRCLVGQLVLGVADDRTQVACFGCEIVLLDSLCGFLRLIRLLSQAQQRLKPLNVQRSLPVGVLSILNGFGQIGDLLNLSLDLLFKLLIGIGPGFEPLGRVKLGTCFGTGI
jgi:hypothetical protein